MTSYLLLLLFGFMAALIGILPPGLINMTAARVGVVNGKYQAISFSVGATIVIFFQTFLALFFAEKINRSPQIISVLQEFGVVLFVLLTIYFLWISPRKTKKEVQLKSRSKTNRFFYGMLLSGLNVFPIPYYVFVSITLAANELFDFVWFETFWFTFGVVLGSFLVFYSYILFFRKNEKKSRFLIEKSNYIVGSITLLVSVLTIFKLLKHHF